MPNSIKTKVRRKAEGKCFRCEEFVVTDRSCCQKHLYMATEAVIKTRLRRRGENKCSKCEEFFVDGKTYCQIHLDACKEKSKRNRILKKVNGECLHCTEFVVMGGYLCQVHIDKVTEREQKQKEEKKANNKCQKCEKSLAFDSFHHCADHYLAHARRGSLKKGILFIMTLEEIRSAWTGNCFYCDTDTVRLVIDHDHSTGKFRNWVCDGCNMKLGAWEHMPSKMKEMLLQEVVRA